MFDNTGIVYRHVQLTSLLFFFRMCHSSRRVLIIIFIFTTIAKIIHRFPQYKTIAVIIRLKTNLRRSDQRKTTAVRFYLVLFFFTSPHDNRGELINYVLTILLRRFVFF